LRHYALVCTSNSSILCNGDGTLHETELRNIGENGRLVGASQVTSAVERWKSQSGEGRYKITTRAYLQAPYAVTLTASRELSIAEKRLLVEVGSEGKGCKEWLAVANQLRRME
jgi:hypothetical protein